MMMSKTSNILNSSSNTSNPPPSAMEAFLERQKLEAEIAALQNQINNKHADTSMSSDLCSLGSMSTNAQRKVVRRVVKRSVRQPTQKQKQQLAQFQQQHQQDNQLPHNLLQQPDNQQQHQHQHQHDKQVQQDQHEQQINPRLNSLSCGGSNHSLNRSSHSTSSTRGYLPPPPPPPIDLTPVDETQQAKLDSKLVIDHRTQLEREIAAMEEAIAQQRQRQLQKIMSMRSMSITAVGGETGGEAVSNVSSTGTTEETTITSSVVSGSSTVVEQEEERQAAFKAVFQAQKNQVLQQVAQAQVSNHQQEQQPEKEQSSTTTAAVKPSSTTPSSGRPQLNFLDSIAQAAASREKRVETGDTVQRDHMPEVDAPIKNNPLLSFDLADLVSQAARDREQRLEDTGGEKFMRVNAQEVDIKEEAKNIFVEAAQLGRLTRLKEHVVEAEAGIKTPEQAWKSQGLLAIQWRSNHMSVIHEAAKAGAETKLPEQITSNCPEYQQDVDIDLEHFYDADRNGNYPPSPRMKQLRELNQRVGQGQHKVDKLVLGRKEEMGIVDNLLVKPMWCYSNVNDVVLPKDTAPKLNMEARRRELAKRPMIDISNEAATRAWERRARLDRPNQTPRIQEACVCDYCKSASPFQTYAYRLKELRQKHHQEQQKDEMAVQFHKDEQRRERERLKAERLRRQALGDNAYNEDDGALASHLNDESSCSQYNDGVGHASFSSLGSYSIDSDDDAQSVYTTQTSASGNRRLVRKVRRVRRVPKKEKSASRDDLLDPVLESEQQPSVPQEQPVVVEPATTSIATRPSSAVNEEKAPAHHSSSAVYHQPQQTGQCCACVIL